MFLFTWFTVDGCYAIYWHFKNPVALEFMRSVNFPASLSLYGMCGIVWLYCGSLRQLASEIRNRFLILRGDKKQNSDLTSCSMGGCTIKRRSAPELKR
jgi:hypothetical protein